MSDIHLGFEIGTGERVTIPCRHMVVTGQSQEAGKTTTMEALIARSNLCAIAFVTKRGEQSFENTRRIPPYFRERADWQFVQSVLEATMGERMKFERSWIIKASKGARSLADVQQNVKSLLASARGLNESVYSCLDSYLEIVVPRIASVRFATRVDLEPGINVLDLSDRDQFPSELQSLVMRSVIEWVYEKFKNTITIIPEAWEFIPQGRSSPVKLAAIELIRKGAGLRNYVWVDSQDIGGVEKQLLRQCPVWLLGVQREANEISRTLDNIPAGIAKPKASDVATLERGQFFACWGKHVVKTYVQPEWMDEAEARGIAMGDVAMIRARPVVEQTTKIKKEELVNETEARELREENKMQRDRIAELETLLGKQTSAAPALPAAPGPNSEELYQLILQRLLKEQGIINLNRSKPELNVNVSRKTVEADETSAQGMIAQLLSEGFLGDTLSATMVWKELKRRWNYGGISARCYEQLDKLTELGFVTKEAGGYKAVPEMKVNIRKL